MVRTSVAQAPLAGLLALAIVVVAYPAAAARSPIGHSGMARPHAAAALANQPLSFEPNRGQTDSRVRYLARGPGYTLFLTGSGAVLSLARQPGRQRRIFPLRGPHLRPTMATRTATLELLPQGMSRHVQITVSRRLPGVVSYFIGKDPTKWHAGIPTYEQVTYHDVYPGIDLVFHGSDGQPEYDWVVRPGADPNGIRLRVAGASALSIDETDRLGMMTRLGRIVQGRPRIYQGTGGEIAGRLVLLGKDLVGIRVKRYDRSRRLVIDPQLQLAYSTYLGGTNQAGAYAIAVDGSGDAYVAGVTASTDFPICGTNSKCASPNTAIQSTNGGGTNYGNAFVSKLSPTGTQLLYSTYLGGTEGYNSAYAIAVDSGGDAYVAGATESTDFPVCGTSPKCASPNTAIQPTNANTINGNAFASKLTLVTGTVPTTPAPTQTPALRNTSTPTAIATATPTATVAPLTLSVKLAHGSIKVGQKQKVSIETAPDAHVGIVVKFPDGSAKTKRGTADHNGGFTWSFNQPKGKAKGKNRTVRVIVTATRAGEPPKSVSKRYKIT